MSWVLCLFDKHPWLATLVGSIIASVALLIALRRFRFDKKRSKLLLTIELESKIFDIRTDLDRLYDRFEFLSFYRKYNAFGYEGDGEAIEQLISDNPHLFHKMESIYGQKVIKRYTRELVFENLMDKIFDYLTYCNTFSNLLINSELKKSAVSPMVLSYVKQAHNEFNEYLPAIKQTSSFDGEPFPYLTHQKLGRL